METNFPGLAHSMVFVEFPHTIGNWLENPYISHVMQSTIGWEYNGEKSTHTMGKVWVPISQVLPIRWVLLDFFVQWKIDGKTMHFPCNKRYHRMGIKWEKSTHTLWEKYEYQFPRSSPYDGFCCTFQYYGKLIIKPMYFPYNEVYHRIGIRWRKSTHAIGKVSLLIFQVFPIQWVLSHFPALWEIDGKTHVFPIRWTIP